MTTKQGGEVAAVMVPVAALRPWVKNPRKNDPAVDSVAASIKRFGFGAPIVARLEDGEVIAGHTRLKAAIRLGLPSVPVRYLDLTPEEARAYALADNKIGELAEWDTVALVDVIRELGASNTPLEGLGWSGEDMDKMLGRMSDASGGGPRLVDPDEDDIPAPPPVPVSKPGEVYDLGPHRLVCGDSTLRETWDAILTEPVKMVWTDPPYGMSLQTDYTKVGHGGGRAYPPITGDDKPFDASPAMARVEAVTEQFWFGADYYRRHLPDGGGWFVWDKRWNDSGMDLDRLIGSGFELCWSKVPHKREVIRILWAMTHGRQGEDIRGVHPTQKPTALVRWFVSRFSAAGAVVADPFGGSGTTLLAAAAEGRVARLIELDPGYCDVIRRRWTRYAKANNLDAGSGALDG